MFKIIHLSPLLLLLFSNIFYKYIYRYLLTWVNIQIPNKRHVTKVNQFILLCNIVDDKSKFTLNKCIDKLNLYILAYTTTDYRSI